MCLIRILLQGVVLEAGLNAGTYTLTEMEAPSGYLKLKNPIKLVITSSEVEWRNHLKW
ncbi:MAG: prealbumin-like fold domain-containing protein [Lachnospiraceae bacterium]